MSALDAAAKVLAETKRLMGARLNVVNATRITLRNILDVLGIDAPDRM